MIDADRLEAMAALVGLTLDPAYRASVIEYIIELLEAAEQLGGLPLDETVEPAPIFRP